MNLIGEIMSKWDFEKDAKWSAWKNYLGWIEDCESTFDGTAGAGFIPYPLQIANGIRIMSNDAVFIFDEVGCGKTISAGIMAQTFLRDKKHKNEESDVLVITTNTIKVNEQFEEDWRKLDENLFPNYDPKKYVTVYNNLFNSDLKKIEPTKKWGLVIIDEAHEFNNTDTERYNSIINRLRAQKVVFLSATPLRGGGNFDFYKKLARAILSKPDMEFEALDKLSNIDGIVDESGLICAKFDPTYPVTRYFKDTIRYLDIHEKKEKAHRVIPDIWKITNGQTREERLVSGIVDKLSDETNRFIIFVGKKKNAEELKEALVSTGEKRLNNDNVRIVFSE